MQQANGPHAPNAIETNAFASDSAARPPEGGISRMKAPGAGRVWLETLAVILLTAAVMLPGIWHTDFMKTEALRAVVAKEMLETGDYLQPQIHYSPYTRKPPLFQWILLGIVKVTGWPLSEAVARMVSVLAAVLFVVVVYWAAVAAFAKRAPWVAATMALGSWVVFEYGSHAELDMLFTAWFTLSHVLLYAAIRTTGWRNWLAWGGTFLAAAVATMSKGPHAVMFLGLTMLGWSWLKRDIRWLLRPAPILTSLIAVGTFMGWSWHLSQAVGAERYSQGALVEFIIRIFPMSPGHIIQWIRGWFTTVPIFAIVTLPASAAALIMFAPKVRSGQAEDSRLASDFLRVWLVTNLAFLTFAIGKSSRYLLPIFGPVALLGAEAWELYVARRLPSVWDLYLKRVVHVIYRAGQGGAAVALGVAIWLLATGKLGPLVLPANVYLLLAALAVAATAVSLAGLSRLYRDVRHGQWVCILALVLLVRPVQIAIAETVTARRDSERPLAAQIDNVPPADSPVVVYGHRVLPDLGFYSEHRLVSSATYDPNVWKGEFPDDQAWFIIRDEDRRLFGKWVRYPVRFEKKFDWKHGALHLVEVDFSASPTRPEGAPEGVDARRGWMDGVRER